MKYTIKFSAQAIRDLERTRDEVYQSSKSTSITSKYIDDLLDKIESKREFPLSGAPLYYEDLFTGYYFVIFKSYLAFYRVDGQNIFVERILYGKSGYIRKLKITSDDDS